MVAPMHSGFNGTECVGLRVSSSAWFLEGCWFLEFYQLFPIFVGDQFVAGTRHGKQKRLLKMKDWLKTFWFFRQRISFVIIVKKVHSLRRDTARW